MEVSRPLSQEWATATARALAVGGMPRSRLGFQMLGHAAVGRHNTCGQRGALGHGLVESSECTLRVQPLAQAWTTGGTHESRDHLQEQQQVARIKVSCEISCVVSIGTLTPRQQAQPGCSEPQIAAPRGPMCAGRVCGVVCVCEREI